MICQPCRENRHADCPSHKDRTWCDCKHEPHEPSLGCCTEHFNQSGPQGG